MNKLVLRIFKRFAKPILTVGVSLGLIATIYPTAYANKGDDIFVGGQTGKIYSSSHVTWASSKITMPNNPYTTGQGGLTCAWSMIDNQDTMDQWAQVGFLKYSSWSQPLFYFEEYDGQTDYQIFNNGYKYRVVPSSGSIGDYWLGSTGPSIGARDTYTVDYTTNSNGTITYRGYVNGTSGYFHLTPAVTWYPNDAQWYNEVKSTSYNRFFGTASNPLDFYGASYKVGSTVYHGGFSLYNQTKRSSEYEQYADITSLWNAGTAYNEWQSWDTRK